MDAEETSRQVVSRCVPNACSKSGLFIVLWEEGFCHLGSPHHGSEQWLYQLGPTPGSVSRGAGQGRVRGLTSGTFLMDGQSRISLLQCVCVCVSVCVCWGLEVCVGVYACLHISVCPCVCVVYVYACMRVPVRGDQRLTYFGCFDHSPSNVLGQGSHLHPELAHLLVELASGIPCLCFWSAQIAGRLSYLPGIDTDTRDLNCDPYTCVPGISSTKISLQGLPLPI